MPTPWGKETPYGALVPVKDTITSGRGQDKALKRGMFPYAFAPMFSANLSIFNMVMSNMD